MLKIEKIKDSNLQDVEYYEPGSANTFKHVLNILTSVRLLTNIVKPVLKCFSGPGPECSAHCRIKPQNT